MTSYSLLEVLRLDIVKVSARIDEVDKELAAAQQSGLAATDSYLRDTLLELPKEKNELRNEKNQLRQQETILLQANVPGQCDASHRAVLHLCIGKRFLQTPLSIGHELGIQTRCGSLRCCVVPATIPANTLLHAAGFVVSIKLCLLGVLLTSKCLGLMMLCFVWTQCNVSNCSVA